MVISIKGARMKRLTVVLVLFSLPLAIDLMAQRRRAASPPAQKFGDPLPHLSLADRALFQQGRAEFEHLHAPDEGLGPVFNNHSCRQCHGVPTVGGGSAGTITRIGVLVNGVFDPLIRLGGPTLQIRAIEWPHVFRPETIPAGTTIAARRRSPALFGLGLVDATSDITFINLAAQQAARNDGTAGRVAFVDNIAAGMRTVGKFGWKAQIPTLHQFAGDAYLNEMGITNPEFPDENCPSGDCAELQFNPLPGLNDDGQDVRKLVNFMRFLGAPPRGSITADVIAGEAVFTRIGCDSCHVQSLQTADGVTYHPYSDFLLHDMGATLADGVPQGDASAREFRTAPLWGLRANLEWFTHTAQVRTVTGAILAHDGQGRASRDRFNGLNTTDRARLLAFLGSL
jgi:CxxC motif-containing protein (DUF1111 family)